MNKAFPRGGVVSKKAAVNDKPEIVFGAVQKKKKIKKSTEPKDDEIIETLTVSTEALNYDSLKDGIIIMGCVRSVDEMCIKISLPSRMTASVSALSISDSYTKTLSALVENSKPCGSYKPLQDLYKIGQIVYGKIIEVKQNDFGRPDVLMSLKPVDVHADLIHSRIPEGFIFNGAISEIQENGYIIESGIKGLRCFMPAETSSNELSIGQLIFMKVEKITYSNTDSTCICKMIDPQKAKIKNQDEVNLDYLLPTNVVNFTVTEKLRNGLQGYIFDEEFKAFVNEHQLSKPLEKLEKYKPDSIHKARILYIMPLTKFVFLSLNIKSCIKMPNYQRGHIIDDAKVNHLGTGGVILTLDGQYKGIISYKTLKIKNGTNYDHDENLIKYAANTRHKVRILDYDFMSSCYICTDDARIINEKIMSVEDVKPGDFVAANVIAKSDKFDGYFMQVGKVKGVLEKKFLQSSRKPLEDNSTIRCRVVSVSDKFKTIYLTNRTEYLSKNCKFLASIEDAKINSLYTGTVVKCYEKFIIVKFFGDLKGILHKNKSAAGLEEHELLPPLDEGQITNFRIKLIKNDQIILTLPDITHNLGEIYPAIVNHVLDSGLELTISNEDGDKMKGFVPIHLLTDFNDLLLANLYTYQIGETIKVASIMKHVFSIRDVDYYENNPIKEWSSVKVGDILKASVKNIDNDVVQVSLPINGYSKLVKVHVNMVRMNAFEKQNVTLTPDQVIYVKVLSKEKLTKTLTISAKLVDVWNCELSSTAKYFEKYLNEIAEIKNKLKKKGDPISLYSIGEKVSANLRWIQKDTKDWQMELVDSKVQGIIKNTLLEKNNPTPKDNKYDCIVLWIDYSSKIVYLSNKSNDFAHISQDSNDQMNFFGKSGINAKILLKLEDILICSLKKGKNPLVYCPTRLHFTDFEKSACANAVENEFCRLSFIHKTLPIAVFEETWKLWQLDRKKRKNLSVNNEPPKKITKVSHCMNENEGLETSKPNKLSEIINNSMPSMSDFWSTDLNSLNKDDIGAQEEDNDMQNNEDDSHLGKSEKLSNSQKFKMLKEKEIALREIEERYANPKALPESIDEFDRLVLSDPNDSKNWINYMAFHLKCAEIDKARSVGQRALKAISFRNSQDQLNIWIALLNLEQRYGSKESFTDLFKDSLIYNDPLQMHLRVLPILSDSNKIKDLDEIITKATKKFKDQPEIWTASANAWFSIGKLDRGNQLLHKALMVLPMKEHVNTIVSFASLNQKYGNTEKAEVLLDQVITSYPKRVDVWAQYIDILIKKGDHESARHTFERAIVQKLPLGKMRTIFKKYLEFEEKFGNPENVSKVKSLAMNYVQKNCE